MFELSDGQELFLVLCLLYLSDCFCWVRRTAVLFTAPFCRRWQLAKPSAHLGNARGHLYFLNPAPPLGEAFLAGWSPFSVSPAGVCDFTLGAPPTGGRAAFTGNVVTYEEIEKATTDGRDLLLNGREFATCADPLQAKAYAALLLKLRSQDAAQRAKTIERHLQGRFAKSKASRAIKRARLLASNVRTWALFFFVLMYVTIPLLTFVHDLRYLLLPAAGVYLLGAWIIAFLYSRAHKALFPELKGERIGNVVKMCGCPPLALRAADLVTLHALSAFHPLVLAHLLQVPAARSVAATFLRDLRHPLRHDLTGPGLEIAEWHARIEAEEAGHYLKSQGLLDLAAVFVEPAPQETCTKYCPRCLAQLRTEAIHCPDCAGVTLRPLTAEASTPAIHV
jgi:hypothetical protein